jgi:hypothetical protein
VRDTISIYIEGALNEFVPRSDLFRNLLSRRSEDHELMRIPKPMRMSAPFYRGRCLAVKQALAQKDLGDSSYQNRHEATTAPTRPSSNATENTTVIKNSSQSSGNLEGTPLRSVRLTRFRS